MKWIKGILIMIVSNSIIKKNICIQLILIFNGWQRHVHGFMLFCFNDLYHSLRSFVLSPSTDISWRRQRLKQG